MALSTVEKVTEIIDIQDKIMVKEFGIKELTAANVALMEKQILEIPEKPETKDQYDDAYRFNVDAKKLIPRIESRRKELKAPVLEKGKAIDDTAKKAVAMVQPLIELSGSRREAWESEKAAEKAEKEQQEKIRLQNIQAKIDMLNHLAAKPMEYNRTSADIEKDIANLEAFEISAIDFQERRGDAELVKSNAIATAKTAMENRRKFEVGQAEAARVKAEQEAKEKHLAAQQAEMEEKQRIQDWFNRQYQETADCINANDVVLFNTYIKSLKLSQVNTLCDRQREAQEYIDATVLLITEKRDALISAQETAEAEAEKLRQEQELIRAERERLEAEKAAAAKAAIITEREAVWDIAHQENFDRDHSSAILEHEQYKAWLQAEMDQARAEAKARWELTEQAKADAAERLKLVGPDKLMAQTIADDFRKSIHQKVKETPAFNTSELTSAFCDLATRIITAIDCFEQAGKELK